MALDLDFYRVRLTLIRGMLATNPADPAIMDTHIIDRQRKLIEGKSSVNAEVNKYLDALQIPKSRGEREVRLIIEKLEQLMGQPLTPDQNALIAAGRLEELRESFQELDTKGTTVFFWNKELQRPMIGDHMVYGFLKSAAEAHARTLPRKNGAMLHSASYTQSIINQHLRCTDEFLTWDRDLQRNESGDVKYLQRSLRAETAQGPRISLAKSEVMPAGAKLDFTLTVMRGSPFKWEHLCKLLDYGQTVGLGQWRNSGKGMFTYRAAQLGPKGDLIATAESTPVEAPILDEADAFLSGVHAGKNKKKA